MSLLNYFVLGSDEQQSGTTEHMSANMGNRSLAQDCARRNHNRKVKLTPDNSPN